MSNNELFILIKTNQPSAALNLINSLKNASFKKQSKIFNYCNQHNENCLMEAAFRGHLDIVKALNNFSVVSINSKNSLGNNALMLSILNEQIQTIQYLLNMSHLDDLLKNNNKKNNILHLALETKNNVVIEVIMKHLKTAYSYRPTLLNEFIQKRNNDNFNAIDLALRFNLNIFFDCAEMIKPLFLLKKQDVKNQAI